MFLQNATEPLLDYTEPKDSGVCDMSLFFFNRGIVRLNPLVLWPQISQLYPGSPGILVPAPEDEPRTLVE
jgi:hypothetical protein